MQDQAGFGSLMITMFFISIFAISLLLESFFCHKLLRREAGFESLNWDRLRGAPPDRNEFCPVYCRNQTW